MSMDIRTVLAPPALTLHLSGRFDFNVQQAFRDAMSAALAMPEVVSVRVNLHEVNYMDSSALGMLLLYQENAQAQAKDVVLVQPSEQAAKVLDIAHMEKMFKVLPE